MTGAETAAACTACAAALDVDANFCRMCGTPRQGARAPGSFLQCCKCQRRAARAPSSSKGGLDLEAHAAPAASPQQDPCTPVLASSPKAPQAQPAPKGVQAQPAPKGSQAQPAPKASHSQPASTAERTTVGLAIYPPAAAAVQPDTTGTKQSKKSASANVSESSAKSASGLLTSPAVYSVEKQGLSLERRFGEVFDEIDRDGDGIMTFDELRHYVTRQNEAARVQMGIGRWEDFIKEVDSNHDGRISRDEFLAYFTHVNLDRETCYAALFDAIDANKDGTLSWEEVRNYRWHDNIKLFQMLGIPNWHAMVANMTKDSHGGIDKKSFITYLMQRPTTGSLPNALDMNLEPAWRLARRMPARLPQEPPSTSPQSGKRAGKRKHTPGADECWDFQSGYCSRGKRCHYSHSLDGAVDEADLDAHRKYCLDIAHRVGVNLSGEALMEMQTLDEGTAGKLIRSLGHGGDHEHVPDKNSYVVHFARRLRANAHHLTSARH